MYNDQNGRFFKALPQKELFFSFSMHVLLFLFLIKIISSKNNILTKTAIKSNVITLWTQNKKTNVIQKKVSKKQNKKSTNKNFNFINNIFNLDNNTGINMEGIPSADAAPIKHYSPAIRDKPILLRQDSVKFTYPKRAKSLSIEGTVVLLLTVNEEGLITETKIASGPDFGLYETALFVVKNLKFLPATDEHGKAVTGYAEHKVTFKLIKN